MAEPIEVMKKEEEIIAFGGDARTILSAYKQAERITQLFLERQELLASKGLKTFPQKPEELFHIVLDHLLNIRS